MKCLYCNRPLGFFNTSKSSFCSEQHEEMYRSAAQRRLEAPYASTAGALESSTAQAESETSNSQDIAQLLQATQVDGGATMEKPAEATASTQPNEAVGESVTVAAGSAEATARAVPEKSNAGHTPHGEPPAGSTGNRTENRPEKQDVPGGSAPLESQPESDRRSAPRVDVVAIIQIATLRNPERELSCALVNKSDAGIQFTSDADFALGEFLIVQFSNQLVLAEVKHSETSGNRYAIGAERVQLVSQSVASAAKNGAERAQILINALCDRMRTGFADETGLGTDGGADHRARALEKVARILEIWQSATSEPAESPAESADKLDSADDSKSEGQTERPATSGRGRTFAAIASGLVIAAVLLVSVYEYRKSVAEPAPASPVQSHQPAVVSKVTPAPAAAIVESKPKPEIKPAPEIKQQVAEKPPVEKKPAAAIAQKAPAPVPAPVAAAPKAKPAAPVAATGAIVHHAQITVLTPTWVGLSTDGHRVFGKMLTPGSATELQYSKYAFIHAGNASKVRITVDGQQVPMGDQPRLRLVELNDTGFQFLRWSNGDPAQP